MGYLKNRVQFARDFEVIRYELSENVLLYLDTAE